MHAVASYLAQVRAEVQQLEQEGRGRDSDTEDSDTDDSDDSDTDEAASGGVDIDLT